jgi:hypothetical protein
MGCSRSCRAVADAGQVRHWMMLLDATNMHVSLKSISSIEFFYSIGSIGSSFV